MDNNESSTLRATGGHSRHGTLTEPFGDATESGAAFSTARRGRGLSPSSYRGLDSDIDHVDADTDQADNGYRRRKAAHSAKSSLNFHGQEGGDMNITDHQGRLPRKGEGHESDFSSNSASEDVELEDMLSEEGISDDDEETGLTKRDRKRRKRRRRELTDLDSRIGGSDENSQGKEVTEKKVMGALLINALLIASWYFFSLSISIVSAIVREDEAMLTDCASTTPGCSHPNTSTFISRSSRHAYTCWCNSAWHHLFSSSFQDYVQGPTTKPLRTPPQVPTHHRPNSRS